MDLQLENPRKPDEFIYVEQHQRRRAVTFTFEHVRFDAAKLENIPISTHVESPASFSARWRWLVRHGWRVSL